MYRDDQFILGMSASRQKRTFGIPSELIGRSDVNCLFLSRSGILGVVAAFQLSEYRINTGRHFCLAESLHLDCLRCDAGDSLLVADFKLPARVD